MDYYRQELIQIAAVAVAMIECRDKGTANGPYPTIINEIIDERIEQNRRWGAQGHDPFVWLAILGEEYGEACQAALQERWPDAELAGDAEKP